MSDNNTLAADTFRGKISIAQVSNELQSGLTHIV